MNDQYKSLVFEYIEERIHPVDNLLDRWSESHRVYHDISHLESCIEYAKMAHIDLNLRYSQLHLLWTAIMYHDIVYIPDETCNEILSANLLMEHLDQKKSLHDAEKITLYEAITGTKDHLHPDSFIAAVLFDIDLAGLGSDSYVRNSYAVRAEFANITDEQWIEGRSRFLNEYLGRVRLFHTSWGSQFEKAARHNMTSELIELRKQL